MHTPHIINDLLSLFVNDLLSLFIHLCILLAFQSPDFSVVLLRSDFVLVSEKNHVKMHKNQWLLTPLSPLDIPCRAKNPGIPDSVG